MNALIVPMSFALMIMAWWSLPLLVLGWFRLTHGRWPNRQKPY